MKKQLKIGAYLRVSTDRQVQVFEGSLETQKYRMEEFVKSRNRENKNWGDIIDFYVDEGISAGTSKRPQYQRLMNDVRSGKIDLILVADISRLSRSVHDFSILLKELENNNASYLSMKEQFDTTTPAGRLMINMVVNMAQFEREQTSERVAINFNSRAMRGFVNGGRTPLGFDRHEERTGTFVVNEKEALKVRTIFNIFKDQGSVGKALPVIEALKIYPKSADTKSSEPNEKKWGYDQLKDLLSNSIYIGIKEVNKLNKDKDPETLKPWEQYQKVKASWVGIVDEELFNEVQEILSENLKSERRRIEDAERRIFLLSGILRCGECGRALCGQSAHGKNQIHRYYKHSNKRNSSSKCSVERIRADDIEQVVVNHLTEVVGRAGYFDGLEKKLKTSLNDGPRQIAEEIIQTKKSLSEVEREISSTFRLQMQVNVGTEAAQLTAEHLDKLGKQKKILMARLLDLEESELSQKDAEEVREEIETKILEFKKGFPKAPVAVRRRLLRKVLEKLVYTPKGLETFFNYEDGKAQTAEKEFNKNEGKLIKFEKKNQTKPLLSGAESDLTLSFEKLPIEVNGWGSRT